MATCFILKDYIVNKYATTAKPHPKEQRGFLSVEKLKKHGMKKERMNDPMFFYRLLYPFIDVESKPDDGRRSYYSEMTKHTNVNLSKNEKTLEGHYCHKFNAIDLVNFDGVNFFHGSDEGGDDIHLRWDQKSNRFQPKVYDCMHWSQWCETRRYIKWNDNIEGL